MSSPTAADEAAPPDDPPPSGGGMVVPACLPMLTAAAVRGGQLSLDVVLVDAVPRPPAHAGPGTVWVELSLLCPDGVVMVTGRDGPALFTVSEPLSHADLNRRGPSGSFSVLALAWRSVRTLGLCWSDLNSLVPTVAVEVDGSLTVGVCALVKRSAAVVGERAGLGPVVAASVATLSTSPYRSPLVDAMRTIRRG